MLATLVYLADLQAENFCGTCTLTAAQSGVDIASAALPRHISLGTPLLVEDMPFYISIAERVSQVLSPLHIELTSSEAKRINIGNKEACWLGFHYHEVPLLEKTRTLVSSALCEQGFTLPSADPIHGTRNLTLVTGTGDFTFYQAASDILSDHFAGKQLTFDKLGVFFYDADTYRPDCNYFCCHRFQLKNNKL